ncbi:DUF1819 domain-containing protein [Rathayibacter sp. AY1A2]|nr:DUF1819 domain-containing protein [Rathayibacter sp. AY1A2]
MSEAPHILIHCPKPGRRHQLAISTDAQGRYALSFTSGGLLVREADVVASVYLRERDWGMVRQVAMDGNLLQARTTSSSMRVIRETIQRLSVLDDAELELLADSSLTERCHLMWVAACRRYELIGDFAEEVLRERYLLLTPSLSADHFDRFITGKNLWHPELDELKPSTRTKVRQNIFRMLHEAGLCSEDDDILPAVLSERVYDALAARTPSDVRFLPTNLPTEVRPR